MGVQVDQPLALLLLPVWAAFIWWTARSTVRLTGGRKAAAIGMRAFILLLLIAVAAGVQPYVTQKRLNIVFVADRSASLDADAFAGAWIAKAIAAKGERDEAGVVGAGLDAAVERTLSPDGLLDEGRFSFRAQIDGRFTDLSRALQMASGMLPEEGGRIVLLSDGEENAGDLMRQARLLKDRGIAVDVLPAAPKQRTDAALEEMKVPKSLRQGESFTIELQVASTFAGPAELRIYADDTELARSEVELEQGANRFVIRTMAKEPGFHRFRAELYAADDEQPANNAAYAFSRVSGPPAVLIVEGEEGSSANLVSALSGSLIASDVIPPERLPLELADYAKYDSIVLNNVPATRIGEKPMQWITRAVGDFGVGLVKVGGQDSYGLGGYFKTPIEEALPVYMDLQGKRQIPSLGLVLIIDRSGSMSDGKLELAKEAAMRTVELLRDQDTVGVLAFDHTPWWVVEPTRLTDRDDVLSRIQGIQPDGGTEIYTALAEGYGKLRQVDAQRKHIILLTDGQSSTAPDYGALTKRITDANMTLSTVAVGDGADTQLLESLANQGKGRYYFTNDQSTLPAIFSRETAMMSRTYIVERTFTPAVGQAGDWAPLFSSGLPAVDAYIATTAKETAEVALLTPEGDPLLARWQYGSGRSVAWTSDLTGQWSSGWIGWPGFPETFVQWVKWTFPQFYSSPYEVSVQAEGGKARLAIVAEGQTESGGGTLDATVSGEAGTEMSLRPVATAPGEYEAVLPHAEPGAYLVRIGSEEGGTTTGFVVPYSPEYRIAGGDGAAKLERVAELTGGRVLDPERPEEAFQAEPAVTRLTTDIRRALLIAALLLWLCDIALRRVSLPWRRLAAALAGLAPGRRSAAGQKPAAGGSAAAAMTRLARRKRDAGEFYAPATGKPPGGAGAAAGGTAAEKATPQAAAAPPADTVPPPHDTAAGSPPAAARAAAPAVPGNSPGSRPESARSAPPDAPPRDDGADADAGSTMSRLLAAKKRSQR
ncbi:VWFA domain-containing protein [Paenibacillus sp. 32O-W]|uniref:VWA domain-containing protein n=1 Tax=Paenibacillus sp. 32O-W TaxID=1695218 RepID=UPI000721C345|nr:VWA domain-containing protein [Paenibacillus sp. 32O-W]ALS27662.1 VWFA domain-containing protein [Paenibacillus sp. 32O-W]